MVRIAQGDPSSGVKVFLKARDTLDVSLEKSLKGTLADFLGGIQDDEAREFQGADYEHIMIRVLLAITVEAVTAVNYLSAANEGAAS